MKSRLTILFVAISFVSCIDEGINISDKKTILEHLYITTKQYYANFDHRPDFDSAYQVALSQVNPNQSTQEFFNVCSSLLGALKDPHIRLEALFEKFYTFDLLSYEKNIDLKTIKEVYLENNLTENTRILYGKLEGNIGYLYLPNFSDWTEYGGIPPETKIAMNALRETNGLIIDLRSNDGGSAIYAQSLAGYFTNQKYFWHSSRNKTGPNKSDFDTPYKWYIEPSLDFNYKNPVVLLTSRFTVSAGERFVLAMREVPGVLTVGQRTAGTQGSVMGREMLNGWKFTLTFEQVRDARGINHDFSGIPPDIEINTGISDFALKDPIIEYVLTNNLFN